MAFPASRMQQIREYQRSLLFKSSSNHESRFQGKKINTSIAASNDRKEWKDGQFSSINRRIMFKVTSAQSLCFATLALTELPKPCLARAAKGAAEYDLEFYMRNLIQGNNPREGNIQATLPPPSSPPRTLLVLVEGILNNQLNSNCIALRTLSQITQVPVEDISDKIRIFRQKVAPAFAVRAKWLQESVTDEYYFDLTCYALYRTAADLMPRPSDYKLRDLWVRTLGQEIYEYMLLQTSSSSWKLSSLRTKLPSKIHKLTDTIPILQQILDDFQSNNFIISYSLGDKNDDLRTGSNVFDAFDDQDIESGLSVNCLVSLKRPATLTSSLQIVGEGSRFIPEFIGTTIAAMWRKEIGRKVEYETYFVDEEYRPNPKDYFPSEQLLQFTIT